ncbi:MAG: hypothetical protein ACOC8B_05235 [Gemmatimonadota bacterium]
MRDSAGIPVVENRPELSADSCAIPTEPLVDIGVVEGEPEYQLYRVMDGATLSDGRIAIVNQGSDEIRIYDADGRFVDAFGREGGGPGEFRDVFMVWRIPGDTLVVADYRPWRFQYFTPGGEFIRAVEPTPTYINTPAVVGVMADGTFVIGRETNDAYREEPGFHPQHLHLVRHGPDGAALDTIGVYMAGRRGNLPGGENVRLTGTPLFEPRTVVAAGGERIVVGAGEEAELRILDVDGELRRLVRWTVGDRDVPPSEVEAYRRNVLELYDDPAARQRFAEPQISDDRPVNDRFPAHATIRIDRSDRIWVRQYPRPSWPEGDRWWVFDRDGRFACHAVTPPMNVWDIFEIGVDYLLGAQQDELDVEHVRVFELNKGR